MVTRESNIRMLTGTIKADWIQLPVERYLAALPTLRQGVIAGVFRNKGAAPWAITRAEKLQLSVFFFSLHFSHNGRPYQAVLVSMSSAPSKSKRGEHAMWKHVLPVSTDFAWLPEDVAEAFCSLALCQDQTRPYGSFHEVQLGFNEYYQAWLHIEGLY